MIEYWNSFVKGLKSMITGEEITLSVPSKNTMIEENRNINENNKYLDIQLQQQQKFRQLCETAKTVSDIKALIKECISHNTSNLFNSLNFGYKITYNKYIGWGIPSPIAVNTIYKAYMDHCKRYPAAKLIDYGAGTGVYSLLLENMGILRDKLIAVDLPVKTHATQREFYPLLIDNKYCVHPDDVMLVVWGSNCYDGVQKYILNGGKCLIIQGEVKGCTFCVGYLDPEAGMIDPALGETGNNWEINYIYKLPSWISSYSECISINTKYG